nr:erythrocyte band 7 integral membrane protein-like [Paramormyrops kingsleyae]
MTRSPINKTCGRSPSHTPPDNIHMEMESQAIQNGRSREPLVEEQTGDIGCCGWVLVIFSVIFMLFTLPVSIFLCLKIVQEYERAVIFRLGRITDKKAKGPGERGWEGTGQGTLLFSMGSMPVSVRPSIHTHTQSNLDEATDSWGIKVERVEIKDVKLPQQLQRAMAAEAEATREARAKVIAAEGEMNASRALKEASLVIAESPSALQLRYLQTLNTIAAEKNSTIVFPLPMDFMAHFIGKK